MNTDASSHRSVRLPARMDVGAEITPFAIDARLRPGTTFKVDAEGFRPGATLSVNGSSLR